MKDQALLAFTLEELVVEYDTDRALVKRGFVLGPNGRFLYTRSYVDRVLEESGLVGMRSSAWG
jgi:predicted TPR repeat methyltransferase